MKRQMNHAVRGLAATLTAAVAIVMCSPALAQDLEPQPIRSYSKLIELLKERQVPGQGAVVLGDATLSSNLQPMSLATSSQDASYSQTLVQVNGVDEADQVKNDGSWIYQLNRGRVMIIRANPANNLALQASLDFTGGDFHPQGLYLDSRLLVVVGTSSRNPLALKAWRKWAGLYPFLRNSTAQAKVYNISDPRHPRKVREIEIDGDYVGTRKIGSTLYLVSRHYPQCYALGFKTSTSLTLATPGFRDSRINKGFQALSPTFCHYLPGFDDPNYLVVGAIDLAKTFSTIKLNAFLGAGQQIHASKDSLYITASQSLRPWAILTVISPGIPPVPGFSTGLIISPVVAIPQISIVGPETEKSDIYKFALGGGRPRFVAAARVEGTILNSYSMDEHNGYRRVATTLHSWFNITQQTSRVYVLDSRLHLEGKLENIAPGEKIYAARFIGNRLFLVTFQQIDPLFAIDLSDPSQPVIGGELVLPGYSSFLLPFDENHLIGFGKDVAAPAPEGTDLRLWNGAVYEQGIKLALFNVSDLSNPTLVSSVNIGDRGTQSPALQDPHALLFDPARNLLAFPISVAEVAEPDPTRPWEYGTTTFQGAYVFTVSTEGGFDFLGAVTHLPEGAPLGSNSEYDITRVLSIGPDLFTLSPAMVKANNSETLAEQSHLSLPLYP